MVAIEDLIMSKAHYLVVDDKEYIRDLISAIFEGEAMVSTASDGVEAFEILSRSSFDAVICDVQMPNLSGLELYQKLKNENASLLTNFIFCTGNLTNEFYNFCATYNVPYCSKPISLGSLKATVQEVVSGNKPNPS